MTAAPVRAPIPDHPCRDSTLLECRQAGPLMVIASLALAGCASDGAGDPVSPEPDDRAAVESTIGPGGGVLRSPAGAALAFPAQALAQPTTVRIEPVAAGSAFGSSGAVLSADAFRVEPEGLALGAAAEAELAFDLAGAGDDAWLASVVVRSAAGARELGRSRVDLTRGVVFAPVHALGTLAVVRPEPAAVYPVAWSGTRPAASRALDGARASTRAAAAPATGIRVECGDPDNRCEELEASASENLTALLEDAAVVYPAVQGGFTFSAGTATGQLELHSSFRASLKSGTAAENIVIDAHLVPTASTQVVQTDTEIRMTDVRHTISGSAESGSRAFEQVADFVIVRSGATGHFSITRDLQITGSSGALEPAWVSVQVPVQVQE